MYGVFFFCHAKAQSGAKSFAVCVLSPEGGISKSPGQSDVRSDTLGKRGDTVSRPWRGKSGEVVWLLLFQSAIAVRFIPRVSLLTSLCPGLLDFSLSGFFDIRTEEHKFIEAYRKTCSYVLLYNKFLIG